MRGNCVSSQWLARLLRTMDSQRQSHQAGVTGETSDEQYKKAIEVANLLRDFLGKWIPPRIKSKDAAFMALKKGDKFIRCEHLAITGEELNHGNITRIRGCGYPGW